MVLESAFLHIKPGQSAAFEEAFRQAKGIIAQSHGFIALDLKKCMEETNKYLLLVQWETLEDHTLGFRKSADYATWASLLHHFYEPFPIVEHYI